MSKNILLATVSALALTLSAGVALAATAGDSNIAKGGSDQADNGSNADNTTTSVSVSGSNIGTHSDTHTSTVGNITHTNTFVNKTQTTDAALSSTVAGSNVSYNDKSSLRDSSTGNSISGFGAANGIMAVNQSSGVGSNAEIAQAVSVGSVSVSR